MNGVTYCRVSSKEQIQGTSLGPQENACREYVRDFTSHRPCAGRRLAYLSLPVPARYLQQNAAHRRRSPRIFGNLVGGIQGSPYDSRRSAAGCGTPGALPTPYVLLVRGGFMTFSVR